jgi:hypothetical protein
MTTTRILTTITGFNRDINATNVYLSSEYPPPPADITVGLHLGWTKEELEKWLYFQKSWIPLFLKYSDNSGSRKSGITDSLNLIINECISYERDHHLYDRIAVHPNATTGDFYFFRIKQSIGKSENKKLQARVFGSKYVIISLKETGHLYHKLLVVSPDVQGIGKESVVKNILVFVAYTETKEAAPTIEKFRYYGDVSQGLIDIVHPENHAGKIVWYFGRVKNSAGDIGIKGPVANSPVF